MIDSFYSIQQALDYLPKCLLCQSSIGGLDCLVPNAISSLQVDYDHYGHGGFYPKITYTLAENGYEDIYEVNVRTNEVDRQVKIRSEECVVGSFAGATKFSYTGSSTPPQSGFRYLYLGVQCRNCKKYEYALQLIIGLDPLAMKRIVLNSEKLIFQTEEMGERRELRNIYTTRKTIYSYFPKPEPGLITQELKQDLPLLPLNREDPHKTLERVKNLLIFT